MNFLKVFFLLVCGSTASSQMFTTSNWQQKCRPGSLSFNYIGSNQIWSVPVGCTVATFKVWGAGGGGSSGISGSQVGGAGGFSTGSLPVVGGAQYTMIVGGGGLASATTSLGGFGGGGQDYLNGGSGGGRSAIRSMPGATDLFTAGGGGGGGYTSGPEATTLQPGGPGGGGFGGRGNPSLASSGYGGGPSAGGAGGTGATASGTGGSQPLGGNAPITAGHAGGGGGGWYGGGSGGVAAANNSGGGGGGSGYVGSFLSAYTQAGVENIPPNNSDPDYSAGVGNGGNLGNPGTNGGNGKVVVSWGKVDPSPAAFDFYDLILATPGLSQQSNILQVTGINTSIPISVSGAASSAYRICTDSTCSTNPAFTSVSGTIDGYKYLQLQVTSSGLSGVTVLSTVTVGDFSDAWNVKTAECPPEYVPIPPIAPYSTTQFCAAKFEASEATGGKGVSVATAVPWQGVSRDQALPACTANGLGYDLITNDQWQAVARNIELVPSNWSTLSIGVGSINTGHSDGAPANIIAAGTDDLNGCLNTGQTCAAGVWGLQKRTHTLSNGFVIWDISGNSSEWMKDLNSTAYGSNAPVSQVTSTTHTVTGPNGRSAKAQFGPMGDYKTLNSLEYGGLGYFWITAPAGALLRGCHFNENSPQCGLFFTDAQFATNATGFLAKGFRCVYTPP